mgnify:CR=1 FL=1
MKKNIYFYDKNEVLLDRFPSEISKEMTSQHKSNYNFIFIHSEYFKKNGGPNKLPENAIIQYNPSLNTIFFSDLIKKYPPHAFICIGLRIPDILLISYFNKLGVKTYMVQHGLFVKHLTRIPFIYHIYSKFNQFKKYFIYSYRISRIINKPFIQTINDMSSFFIRGNCRFKELKTAKESNLISNKVFAFDDSWNNYYNNYGYEQDQFIFFGNPDYSIVKKFNNSDQEDAVCYICQTLVEDGRYMRKDYLKFLFLLKKNLPDKKVYLKLHPRSDMRMYQDLESQNFILTRDFKNCKTYLGHYSSLLEISYQLGRKVILWDLEGHPIPDNYLKYADFVANDFNELNSFIEIKLKRNTGIIKKKMSEFLKNDKTPFRIIADKIIMDVS